ncbi:iron-sulfur cluster assembly protein IscA [Natronospira bacteriovora]|uniref:Iron-binding protein IscA n=1 Tax=Natronospira bacteriovora TaxID=3069753 RepID=A0ABU0W419_9GAMM|nr:iron-sulfur cluster assembly protein IscA [Natronospira sp. AB-CW4]MDQ2068717.1 iron-sulfur cluster assembly protein IscA [Natronospira sp. AB-CW4]
MSISLTESAARRVSSHLEKRGHGIGLRLGIKKTGCSGWAYVIDYADEQGENDVVFEDRGVKVIVNRDHLGHLDGTELDYVREGINEAFKFRNPNVKDECGCGESFTVS